jgi:putative ABC transport system permease protein
MKLREIAFRNIKRNTRRSLLCMIAIGLAALCFVFMFSLIEGIKVDLRENLHTYYTGEIRVRNKEYSEYEYLNPLHLNITEYEEIIGLVGETVPVEAVSPRVQFGTGIYREGNTYPAVGLGVDFEHEREYQDFDDTLIEGRLPENGKNETVLGVGLAKEIGLDVGDKVTLLTKTMRGGTNALTLEITGLLTFPVGSLNSKFFIAPLDRMQYFLRMNDGVTDVLVKVENRMPAEEAAAEIRGALATAGRDELEVLAWNEISETYSVMKMADTSYMIIAFLFFLLGSTVIINTTMMVVYERTKEIGTIAAMGMTGPEIVKLFFLEALFISILGSLLGVAAGIGITIPVSKIGLSFGDAMEGIDWEISPVFYPVLNFKSTVFVFIYSTVIASAASFIPSRRAAKIKPVEALRAI